MSAHAFQWGAVALVPVSRVGWRRHLAGIALAGWLLALAAPALAAAAPSSATPAADTELAALPEATPKAFSSRVEPDRVELGRPFRLTLEVRHDPAERYTLAGEPALGGLTARGAPVVERTEADGVAVTRISFELSAFDALGDRELPQQLLVAEGPAGRARLAIPGPPLHVVSTSEGEELANPPPEPLMVVAWDRIGIVAVVLLALCLVAVYVIWRGRRREDVGSAAPIDRRTPEERALAQLDALDADRAVAVRERFFRLSAIVRGFLSEVSGLPAVDRTSEELCEELSHREVPGLSLLSFRAWLGRGDLVRFARLVPPPDVIVADAAEARALVQNVAAALRAEEERRRVAEAAVAAPKAGEGGS